MKPLIFQNMPENSEIEFNPDQLSRLFDMQRLLMNECGANNVAKDFGFLLTAVNLIGEVVEATEQFGDATKIWKVRDGLVLDFKHIKEEWIDILFFWMQGAIQLGLTSEDTIRMYIDKHAINMERVERKVSGR